MLPRLEFLNCVYKCAHELGYEVKPNSKGLMQIAFPNNKTLHEDHLIGLYPKILQPNASIRTLIDEVAPGRPCTHKPMRQILEKINLSATINQGATHDPTRR